MNTKKAISLFLAFCLVLTFAAGCGGSDETAEPEPAAEPEQVISVAYYLDEDHPVDQSMKVFKEYVETNNDSLKVELLPGSSQGSEEAYMDSVRDGKIQIGITGTMLANEWPLIYAEETPFLFRNWEDAKTYLNGDFSMMLFDGLEEDTGLMHLGTIPLGFREFSCIYNIQSMDDFRMIRMRVPNEPNYIEMVAALGGAPLIMDLNDLFDALEQKSVDGQDNPYSLDYDYGFYKYQQYALESRHMMSPLNIFVNAEFFNDSLTDGQRETLIAGMSEAIEHNWEISETYDSEAKQKLIDEGMEITAPDDELLSAMQEAMAPVYQWYYGEIQGAEEYINAVLTAEGRP